jgi:hypothetical protein
MKKIFIFGDSIAYGAWDPEGGWVERLRQWLFVTTRDEYNLGTFLYNLSIVGETTADLLKRFTTEIEARQPGDIIFFATLLLSLGKQLEQRGMRAQRVLLRGPVALPPRPFAHFSAPSRCSCGSHRSARHPLGSEIPPRPSV